MKVMTIIDDHCDSSSNWPDDLIDSIIDSIDDDYDVWSIEVLLLIEFIY